MVDKLINSGYKPNSDDLIGFYNSVLVRGDPNLLESCSKILSECVESSEE